MELYLDERRGAPRDHTTIDEITTPMGLEGLAQFVAWKYGKIRPNGKREKAPINPHNGKKADVNDAATWGTVEEARHRANDDGLDGIGFVFTQDDEFAGVDLDNCINPETGEIDPWAVKLIEKFDSYTEISPSGKGVKIIVRGRKPEGRKRRGPVEMYDRERYFTITGDALGGYGVVESRQEALEGLHTRMSTRDPQKTVQAPRGAVPVALEDHELVEKARNARGGTKFRSLYDHGDLSGHDGNHSGADFALLRLLAFWTGRDADRMERMFDTSALGNRPKWRGRPDYRRRSIENAIAATDRVYEARGSNPGHGDEAVHRILEGVEAAMDRDPWTGRSGPTDRHMGGGFVELARKYGKATDEGVEVYAAWRTLAEITGVSDPTAKKSIKRITEEGEWVRLKEKGKGRNPNRYLIPSKVTHKRDTGWGYSKVTHKIDTPHPVLIYGEGLSRPVRALLVRWRNPVPVVEADYDKNGRKIAHDDRNPKIPRGKGHALALERIVASPGITLDGLAASLERKTYNLARIVAGLVEDGFIFEFDGGYYPPHDLEDRLLDERRDTGAEDRERLMREKHDRERQENEKRLRALKERVGRDRADRLRDAALDCGVDPSEIEADVVADPPSPSPRPAEAKAEAKGVSAPVADTGVSTLEDVAVFAPVGDADDWMDHALDCNCAYCTSPVVSYARPWGVLA